MPREAGKFGRLPFDPERRHLVLERYLDPRAKLAIAAMPAVAPGTDVDRASAVASWPVYLNNAIGDCTIAAAGHTFAAMCVYAGLPEPVFADATIQQVYSAISGYIPGDPATDSGCVMSDVLSYLKTSGMTDTAGKVHKVAGSARLGNPADLDLLGQVLDVTGTVYTGFNVQQHNVQQFSDHQPWTWQAGDQAVGGHCVDLQRRFAVTAAAPLEYVTWGALQPADLTFQAHLVEEAWFVASEDFIRVNGTSIEGMDLQQLLADAQDV